MAGAVGAIAILLFYAVLQFHVLPPDGFFTGDQGTKLLQTIGALDNGPSTPWIEGAADAFDPEMKHREPLLVRSADGGHLVGLFPLALPAVTAPFLAVLGLRGVYAVPALSVAAIFAGVCFISRRCRQPHPVMTGLCAVAATPVLFYGAEFWEHAPAAALTTWAVGLAITGCPGDTKVRTAALAGGLVGLASAFRPEAILLAPAMSLAGIMGTGRRRVLTWMVALPLGTLAVYFAAFGVDWWVYGTPVSPHFTTTFADRWSGFLAARGEMIGAILFPTSPLLLFAAGGVLVGAVVGLRPSSPWRLLACHVAVGLLVWGAVGEPAWRSWRQGTLVHGVFKIGSVAHAWPFAFPLAYLFALPRREDDSALIAYVLWTVGTFVVLAVAAMPNSGGTQWGARYLLPAAPLTAIVAMAAWNRAASAPAHARSARVAILGVVTLSVVVQILGLRVLYQDKMMYARFGQAVEQSTGDGEIIVSDLFWVPQTLARLYGSRALLFAGSPTEIGEILQRAAATNRPRVVMISAGESGVVQPPTYVLPDGVTFERRSHRDMPTRRPLGLDVYTRGERQN